MPPSCGKRDESSVTTSPCGTKKNTAASSQSTSALGPALPAVASHRRPTTATRLKSTRSRSPRVRGSTVSGVASGAAVALRVMSVIREGSEAEQVARLQEERVVGAREAAQAEAARKLERLRGLTRVQVAGAVAEEEHRARVRLIREQEVSAEAAVLAGDRLLIREPRAAVVGDDRQLGAAHVAKRIPIERLILTDQPHEHRTRDLILHLEARDAVVADDAPVGAPIDAL